MCCLKRSADLYLCLRCWRQTDIRDLTVTCPLCEEETVHPLARRHAASSVRSVLPPWKRFTLVHPRDVRACSQHAFQSSTLWCSCGERISSNARVENNGGMLGLGIAGAPGAGKTTMMLAALYEMKKARMEARLLGIGDTTKRFKTLQDRLFSEHLKPERTLEASREHGFGWRVRKHGKPRNADRLLVMHDLAGNIWTDDARVTREDVSRYINLLGKVVLVLDGARIAADLGIPIRDDWEANQVEARASDDDTVLENLFEHLGSRTDNMDLALAVSKGDLIWDQPKWEGLRVAAEQNNSAVVHGSIGNLLAESGRGGIIEFAREFKHTHQFIFSSLGFRPMAVNGSQTGALVMPPAPIGADGPIRWLLGTD